jgi:hypothetical protein
LTRPGAAAIGAASRNKKRAAQGSPLSFVGGTCLLKSPLHRRSTHPAVNTVNRPQRRARISD